jgi:hypothetical protein
MELVIQMVFNEMTACCKGGYSRRVYEHQPGLFMVVVKIWDPGIQIITTKTQKLQHNHLTT